MLEPYPDEFVVQMLELLNPASALKILQRLFIPAGDHSGHRFS